MWNGHRLACLRQPARLHHNLAVLIVVLAGNCAGGQEQPSPNVIRVATFNTSLNRRAAGELIEELTDGQSKQPRQIAEIIQRVRPHVILLNEFDYDPQGQAVRLFRRKYLGVGQNGQQPLDFHFWFAGPVNTGVSSGLDLNDDGKVQVPQDAFGFGQFPGQYGMVVFSTYRIDVPGVRTFQRFLWKDMPSAMLPVEASTGLPYYGQKVLNVFRLSSKSHWDVPIVADGKTLHLLASHPTPPVFDGPEDRNGRRNHDEIRLFADYIDPHRGVYIYDDQGRTGGLGEQQHFVIAGDLNADPHDGDSMADAVQQLIAHRLVNSKPIPSSLGGVEQSQRQAGINRRHRGNPAHDTSDFNDQRVGNLRLDYLLPSTSLKVVDCGIFWPDTGSDVADLVESSDHRLVWIDIQL